MKKIWTFSMVLTSFVALEIDTYAATVGTTLAIVSPVVIPAVTAGVNSLSNWNSDCSVGSLDYRNQVGISFQKPKDDEFLYLSKSDYDTALVEFEKHSNSGSGKGYECDGAGSRHCKTGDVVRLKAGHVFNGNVVNQPHQYKCRTAVLSGNDYWEDLGVIKENNTEKACKIEGRVVKVGDHIHVDCKKSSYENVRTGNQCRAYCLKDKQQSLVVVYGIEDCPKGFVPEGIADLTKFTPSTSDRLYYRCVKQNKPKPEKTCEQLYKGNPEAIWCCNNAKLENAIVYLDENQKCHCVDKNKEFSYNKEENIGLCISKSNEELSDCWYKFNFDIKCSNGNFYKSGNEVRLTKKQAKELKCTTGGRMFAELEQYGSSDKLFEQAKLNIEKAKQLIDLVCGPSVVVSPVVNPVQPVNPTVDIEAAKRTLNRFFANAKDKASVWKTEDGSFNTARLASDLTAGVVLGTVGGVVSGHIIKKKQIEKGFEVLHCTVGGQTVAGWGDEFSVGLRK